MQDRVKLAWVRSVHTAIYIVMASSVLFIDYCGITRHRGFLLAAALALVSLESIVFLGNGMKCPLTRLARKYGAVSGYAFDTLFPEKCTRHTFRVFGGLLVVGIVLLAINNR